MKESPLSKQAPGDGLPSAKKNVVKSRMGMKFSTGKLESFNPCSAEFNLLDEAYTRPFRGDPLHATFVPANEIPDPETGIDAMIEAVGRRETDGEEADGPAMPFAIETMMATARAAVRLTADKEPDNYEEMLTGGKLPLFGIVSPRRHSREVKKFTLRC